MQCKDISGRGTRGEHQEEAGLTAVAHSARQLTRRRLTAGCLCSAVTSSSRKNNSGNFAWMI